MQSGPQAHELLRNQVVELTKALEETKMKHRSEVTIVGQGECQKHRSMSLIDHGGCHYLCNIYLLISYVVVNYRDFKLENKCPPNKK